MTILFSILSRSASPTGLQALGGVHAMTISMPSDGSEVRNTLEAPEGSTP